MPWYSPAWSLVGSFPWAAFRRLSLGPLRFSCDIYGNGGAVVRLRNRGVDCRRRNAYSGVGLIAWNEILRPKLASRFKVSGDHRHVCAPFFFPASAALPFLRFFAFRAVLMPGNKHIAGYTGLVLGVSSAASTIAAVYLGRLGDKIGHQRIAFFSAIGTALFYFPQSFVTKPWQLMVLYTLTGAGIGGLTPSLAALLAKLSKPADAGSVYGIDNSITAAEGPFHPLLRQWLPLTSGFGGFFAQPE